VQRRQEFFVRRAGAWFRIPFCKGHLPLSSPYWHVSGSIRGVSTDYRALARRNMSGLSAWVCSVLYTWRPCKEHSFALDHTASMVWRTGLSLWKV
jgi:hypothetical protein